MLGPRMPCTPFLCCERALLDGKALEHTEHLKSNYEVIELERHACKTCKTARALMEWKVTNKMYK